MKTYLLPYEAVNLPATIYYEALNYWVVSTAEITSFTGARYGRGLGPVHLNNLRCTGQEELLVQCQRNRFGQDIINCRDHSRDIAISCGSKTYMPWISLSCVVSSIHMGFGEDMCVCSTNLSVTVMSNNISLQNVQTQNLCVVVVE